MMVPFQRFLPSFLILLLAVFPLTTQEPNRNVRFGLPSPAQANPRQRTDYLIARPQYVLSSNAEKRTPNWVCWQLKASDIGSRARAPFQPDPDLPTGLPCCWRPAQQARVVHPGLVTAFAATCP